LTLPLGEAAHWAGRVDDPVTREQVREQLSIGEFARRSRLSPKALRLYDEMGLLLPARVDATSGYRYYEVRQLERARLVSALRQLEVPWSR
jgi:PPM family protein phosphatase